MTRSMTKDQRIAMLEVTDNCLAQFCGCQITKAGEGKMFPFEKAMVELLLVEWGDASKKSVAEAVKRLGNGAGPLSDREIKGILKLLSGGIATNFGTAVSQDLSEQIDGGFRKGKKDIFKKFKLKAAFTDIDDTRIDWLHQHHMYWIDGYYDKHVSGGVAKVIASGLEEGLGRKDIGTNLKEFFDDYPGISNKPENYWRGLAANGMNRTRNFGMLQGWEELDVKSLEIVAVMDERTSLICQQLNGKTIPVATALGQRDLMMAAESPEDIKTIAPWPSLTDIKGKSMKNIMGQGVVMPPYHFHCRTTVVERFT